MMLQWIEAWRIKKFLNHHPVIPAAQRETFFFFNLCFQPFVDEKRVYGYEPIPALCHPEQAQ